MRVNQLFDLLFTEFLNVSKDIEAVIVSDQDGLIISGKKRENVDMELISVLSLVINPILKRIRMEFSFKKLGMASFDTDEFRLLFISINEEITLSLVLHHMASVDALSPYGFYVAEKVAQILLHKDGDVLDYTIPNLDLEAEKKQYEKERIYQLRLDTGGIFKLKVIILGDQEVGKTSIVRRFVDGVFSDDYRSTLGVNLMTHSVDFHENSFKFMIWDLGGQLFFKRLRQTYYRGTQAAFIVFDLTNRKSFENLIKWYDELLSLVREKEFPSVIIGNKSDLVDERKIERTEITKFINELYEKDKQMISYIETSALTGENILEAFNLISYHFIVKSRQVEEDSLKVDIVQHIDDILAKKENLAITFVTEDLHWVPGLEIFSEIKEIGNPVNLEKTENTIIYEYPNGLKLKGIHYTDFELDDSDGFFIIFDSTSESYSFDIWKEFIVGLVKNIPANRAIFIGIKSSEIANWSQLIEKFDINEYLEEKPSPLIFFKVGGSYRLEVFDQLIILLEYIRSLSEM